MKTPFWKRFINGLRFRVELWFRNRAPFGYRSRRRRLFFPGCSLPSSDPDLSADVYRHLRDKEPTMGIWSACCGRPLRQFVDDKTAEPFQRKLLDTIQRDGIEEIVTACGNCQEELSKLTRKLPDVRLRSLYDLLAEDEWEADSDVAWTVHHPCPARRDPALQKSFGKLADSTGLQLTNPGRARHPLPCCLVQGKSATRKREKLAESDLITYCAHCTRSFQKDVRTRHVLQVLFGSKRSWHPVSTVRSFLSYRRLRRQIRE